MGNEKREKLGVCLGRWIWEKLTLGRRWEQQREIGIGLSTVGFSLYAPRTCERAVILKRVFVYLCVRVHRWILHQCLVLKCSYLHLIPFGGT